MDFFQSQDVARRNTTKLVVLFLLAVISLIAMTNVLIMITLGLLSEDPAAGMAAQLDWGAFIWVSVAVIAVVAFGSLYKVASLSGGGARVAEMMQAQLIVDGTGDLDKQRVLNVVEEMAIASGTPVPPVYLMEEDAINAFAAGYSPADAVIGVTRGAIQKLSREELQGVIAHEFSHILHGDMRLNIRLIGLLHGIMVLGLMGYYLMRSAAFSGRSRNGGQIAILGLGLVVIGFAGTFFGNLIKSAVSRQREYLADASAVQYTRNPDGIAGALKRIGADSQGSVLQNPAASEISHALFSKGVKSGINSMFATHPPLKKRIKSIQPNWDGSFDLPPVRRHEPEPQHSAATGGSSEKGRSPLTLVAGLGVLAEQAMAQAGNPKTEHIRYAEQLHARLPAAPLQAAHDPYAARALIYVLVLADDAGAQQQQLAFIEANADTGVHAEVINLMAHRDDLQPEFRLPLINIALSGMRQMSAAQYTLFRRNLAGVLRLDDGRGLQQWIVHKIVTHHLDEVFPDRQRPKARGNRTLAQSREACSVLLSWLVHAGEQEGLEPQAVFDKAVAELDAGNKTALEFIDGKDLSLAALDKAADELAQLRALLKPRLLKACATCIAADGKSTVTEQELFRAVAEIIDCPMPPLLPQS